MSTTKKHFEKTTHFFKMDSPCEVDSKPFVIQKTIEESIVMSLLNLTDAITKKGETQCQRFGITTLQYHTMLYLAGDPNIEYIDKHQANSPIVASELAAALNVSRPNVTNLLNLLIQKNLVKQVKDNTDWRKKPLILTEQGWGLIEKMAPHRYRTNRQLLTHLSEEDKTCFLECLRTCRDLID